MIPKSNKSSVMPVNLHCEYLESPLGVDTTQPRFSWILESQARGECQTAYQILIASAEEKLDRGDGDKWDSGKVDSDRSVNVAYAGKALESGEICYWKIRAWDKDGNPGVWSDAAIFEMGLLEDDEWKGVWIAAKGDISAPLLRKEFTVDRETKLARAYISGIGYYEMYINGEKVGDHVLDPGTTFYNNDTEFDLHARVLYVTHDVTEYLKIGQNAVGVMLANGWYSSDDGNSPGREPYADRPKLILQMNIEFADGESVNIVTDGTWKASSGPITANDISNGEDYDARLEKAGWKSQDYDDSGWDKADIADPPGGDLTSQMLEPSRVMEIIKPVSILEPAENIYIYDFGQNFSGWARLRVSGPRGAKATLRHAGRLYDDHRLDARNNGGANQTDTYILKGEGVEVWEPRFTLHGFRYVEMTGFPGTPTLENLEGCFVRSAVKNIGSFRCSNPLINQIHHNVRWTFMSSFQSIPQDAAERSERVGWLGDTGFVAEDYMYNFHDASFWSKWLDDISDSQKPDGDVPVVSPLHWRSIYEKWPAWKSSYPLFVWYIYQYYDDKRVLERHYDGMKKLVDFLGTFAENYIISNGLGDHMEPQTKISSFRPRHTPASLTSTAYYYYDAWIQSQAAEILGKSDDAKRYSDLADKIKDAFNREFLDENTNQYATGSQTSNALPLYMGMVPEDKEKAVAKNLVEDIMVNHHGHLSTGIIGTNALEQVLPEYGWANVMYEITTQTTFPSWGYEVLKGATTIWETFEYCSQHCLNMKMFASVEIFLYKCLAGISPASSGYREIVIKPHIIDDLKDVSASIETVRGMTSSNWVKDDNGLHLDVTIPVNSQAKVSVPRIGLENVTIKESGETIWENGSYIGDVAGITGGSEDDRYVTFDVGSGSYSFEIQSATPRKPRIEYSDLEAPESVKPRESFQVSAIVKNVSEYNLLPEIPLTHGRTIDWQIIPLESGESNKVTFTLELNKDEELNVRIGSLPPKTVHAKTDD